MSMIGKTRGHYQISSQLRKGWGCQAKDISPDGRWLAYASDESGSLRSMCIHCLR